MVGTGVGTVVRVVGIGLGSDVGLVVGMGENVDLVVGMGPG